ncbi:Similar to Cellular nucleic acid-binding protein; acc. no. Q3T0Q6 [Pyronema omphalodes CBS 100304]|uniref:Similar to Cellular nucleic acid-binding protein acc. no. Q3T0Q6 n=1 Tax=Pyronema omphalodes (strain CBS 100304) TaxID=1076935 RepID=U4L501_PYROM|nr:Similar to Cellular nucleic acid-binding protein; acc. no. Q3T0Q6 [Pyronema omphalodes CBS 100304]
MTWETTDTGSGVWGAPAAESSGFKGISPPPSDRKESFAGFDDGFGYGADSGDARMSGDADGVRDSTCRYCKEEGHMARECPTKPANDGACFNCGEQGHSKADCTNPRKFTGTCRICSQEGHAARECPEKPPSICRNCQEEGHSSMECTNKRVMDTSHIKEREDIEAIWADMTKANEEDDFDAFKEHMLEYIKANPSLRLDELENAFRGEDFNYYLYALEVDVSYDKCLVGPHGEPDAKYIWTLNKTPRPRRSKLIAHRMAKTTEGNLERLKYAGTLEDEIKPFCYACKEKGHNKKNCQVVHEEEERNERVVLKCNNCGGLDHRMRDCTIPRKNYDACRNCGQEGHRATECENPRVASADTECRNCHGTGHFSKDCPDATPSECFNCGETGHRSSDCTNERVSKCRNCDERGHVAKECPKPRDVTKVKCNDCNEMGHFSRNCPNPKPVAEVEDERNFSGGYNSFGGDANNGDSGTAPTEDFGSVGGFRKASKPSRESKSKPAWETESKPTWETDAGAGGDTWGSGVGAVTGGW